MLRRFLCLILAGGCTAIPMSAWAQGGFHKTDPNMRNFYMARQEWQYVDQSPVITGTPPNPAAQGQGQGALPAAPATLPKAGWTPYSSSIPSVQNALPKVNNGVPKPMPATPAGGPSGTKGKAGSLKVQTAAKPTGPVGLKAYTPYKGYGVGATAPGTSTGAGVSTSTNVKGNVLQWARPKVRNY